MVLGPYLRREWIRSIRRRWAFKDRIVALIPIAGLLAALVYVWDWGGNDRSTARGAAFFALCGFGLIVWASTLMMLTGVVAAVAPAIASERDRKSLDSLLATPASGAEIVLGAIGAGLLRYWNGTLALVPIVIFTMHAGGIDPRLILLAGMGLASTAVAMAALAVAVSAGARTGASANSRAVGLATIWMGLPLATVAVLPRIWPVVAAWVVPIAICVLDSCPVVVLMSLTGGIPRGPLTVVVLRMIALQSVAAVALACWAMARLRPASRRLHDREGRAASRRLLRSRRRPRRACGDDPVFWLEVHSAGASRGLALLVERLFNLAWLGILAYLISWFAVPAFAELIREGYGPDRGVTSLPPLQPLARVIVAKAMGLPADPASGQARLEFNIILRQTTGLFDFLYVLMVAGAAAESVVKERDRETWLGLIATPLTGWEIVRAKLLGAIWKTRGLAVVMIALWAVGLAAGSLHPIGFLATVAGLASTCGFLAAVGVSVSLRAHVRSDAMGRILFPLMASVTLSTVPFLWPDFPAALVASATSPFQAWASLLSHDDVQAMVRGGIPPQFETVGIRNGDGARLVLAVIAASVLAQAVAAIIVFRSAARRFDAAVGRPTRPKKA